ncbi:MAG: chromosome segregation protein SMC [Oscillospiraceae bacterium]|nr:chromosome segregation protein SMC [Oscillospiraceae bacterium]
MQGFKSFPEKTRLLFEKPITGVVGPNGSGKSNISDAIMWVMGEQSTRSLRSGKMEDVIFGGTQRRSQLGFAEVSLILDNSSQRFPLDSSEVMITRRYYRSGESEYYINKNQVRLRDVNELFMDTGLGREGYSIIGQGKIADILSSKSKDRREIFEEAAGISKHRHRKEESERKLSQTDENLLRIGDKISELEMQIEPLREQAEIAKKYLLLRDELRSLEVSVWLRELESLKLRASKAADDHLVAQQSLEAVSLELESAFTQLEELTASMRQRDIEAESLREQIASEEVNLGELESFVAVHLSQIQSNVEQIERINLDVQNQEGQQGGVGAQILDRQSRLLEISQGLSKLDEKVNGVLKEIEKITVLAGERSKELADLMKSEDDGRAELADARGKLSALAMQAQELLDSENTAKHELAIFGTSLLSLKEAADNYAEKLNKAKDELISQNNVIAGLQLKVDNRADKAAKANEKSQRLQRERQTLQSRKNLLSDLERDYQGYSKAVKYVMQESSRGSLKNICGTVASLVKTKDKYTAAIETALGAAMQNIIVKTEDDGKAAINQLQRNDEGRATFLPVSTINGRIIDENEVNGDEGFQGVAVNLIEYDSIYSGIYASLLGRVIISDDINSALRIARKNNYRYRVVSLDGQVINAGGSMTGGSTASASGILSRANELERIESQLLRLSDDISTSSREQEDCNRELKASEYELDVARNELRTIQDGLILLQSELDHQNQLLEIARGDISSRESALKVINGRMDTNSKETEEIKDLIVILENKWDDIKKQYDKAAQGQELLSKEREALGDILSKLAADKASLDAENAALVKTINELSAIRDEMEGNRERQLLTIDELKQKNDEIQLQILDNQRKAVTVNADIEEYKQRVAKINTEKLEIEGSRSQLNRDIQNKNQETLNLERECSRLEQRKLAAAMEEKQIVDRLWDTYELTRSSALNAAMPIDNLTDAQRNIRSIKSQMNQLGEPNIGAIEQFSRINERYSFLTSQRDDVENAKKELLSIISDITTHMQEIFVREFALINESFEKTFKELFGGGNASLMLEEPEDILSSGIEIQVQPPGKSLKTITLLSGGEKAFVAIAIYFAILAVRPPPFVVIDEIDAALDDANVARFASYMRRMSNNTQMIVISHKRATMEQADVLYGVTMQEMGVSRILHLDLEEAEKQLTINN